MEKTNKNEELQSRREFFKKAAKGALPILAAVALAGAPNIISAAEKSPMGCPYSCSGGCDASCTGCKGSCRDACTSCHGTCSGYCKTTCNGYCKDSCAAHNK